MSQGRILRGDRTVTKVDFATAAWERNEFGVDVLVLSADPVSGAVTFALNTPSDFVYPEEAHFYDCDEDLFQFEGEFHHDELLPYHAGDYVYRPVGTVYGHGEGSADGGIIIASLARERVRFHFQGHPGPWTGHYLVDRLWNPRPVQPFLARSRDLPWEPSPLGGGIEVKRLRGEPGVRSATSGASVHSPWAADAAFLMRVPAGYAGDFPAWPDTILEVLVLDGRARIGGEDWHRGCYGFGHPRGPCRASEDLVFYARSFAASVD